MTITGKNGPPVPGDEGAVRAANKLGCDALLRAHLRTRMHWITDRAVFDATCERLRRGE